MSAPDGRRLSGADSSWWHMERPDNQMAVTAVMTFDGPLDLDRLRYILGHRLADYDRFHQRIREPVGGIGRPRWIDDDLDLDRHLSRVSLPAPADQAALQALVGSEMSRPLDYGRPLWRMVYVDNYETGSALVARLHHCIADGLALVRVLLSLDDQEGNEEDTYARYRPPARGLLGHGLALGARAAGSLGRVVGMRPDPRSTLRGDLAAEKRAAWSRPLRLDDLRAAAGCVGGTLNDVVLSTIAGALGRFLVHNGDRLTRQIRAVVPVSLRRVDEPDALGNRFGLVFAPLPVAIPDPVERLAAVRASMDRIKRSPEAGVLYGMLELFGRTPQKVLDLAVWFLGSKASLVLTNVPGPRAPVWFCGRRMLALIAWVPQSGRLGLGVSVLSYGSEIRLGVASDAGLVPRPQALVDAYEEAARELMESAGLRTGVTA